MRIVYFDEENSVKFSQLTTGCVFYYEGQIFMKILRYGTANYNSVAIDNGTPIEFTSDTYVLPLDARLVIEKGAI